MPWHVFSLHSLSKDGRGYVRPVQTFATPSGEPHKVCTFLDAVYIRLPLRLSVRAQVLGLLFGSKIFRFPLFEINVMAGYKRSDYNRIFIFFLHISFILLSW